MIEYPLGALQSPPDDRDWPVSLAYATLGVEEPVALPTAYRVPPPYTAIQNQIGPRCVAYSAAEIKAYQDLRDQGAFDFDELTFFDRIGGTVNGAYGRDAFKEMLAHGYPVAEIDDAASHKIAAYYSVPVGRQDTCAAIMALGPVMLLTPWARSWNTPGPGGLLPAFDSSIGGHALESDGWDQRGLVGPNTWGPGWGDGGRYCLPWSELARVWETWKSIDVIEAPDIPVNPPKPPTYSLRFAPLARVVHYALSPSGCLTDQQIKVWGPKASSAPCKKPGVKRGCHSGQATVGLVGGGPKSEFRGRYVRIGSGVSLVVK